MHAVSYMHNMHSIGMILLNGTTIVTIMLTKLLNEIAFRIYQNIIQIKITLSIYMSCIHLFFSFIWVSRKTNKGFTFHFHMPLGHCKKCNKWCANCFSRSLLHANWEKNDLFSSFSSTWLWNTKKGRMLFVIFVVEHGMWKLNIS